MRQLTRLLRYALPYWWQVLASVVMMAAVGFLDSFRLLLIGPILDRVLNPSAPARTSREKVGSLVGTTTSYPECPASSLASNVSRLSYTS